MSNLASGEEGPKDGVGLVAQAEISLRDRVRQASRQFESEIILEALEKHRWNRRRTAEALHISYRLLMYKMKSCNLRSGSPIQRPQAN